MASPAVLDAVEAGRGGWKQRSEVLSAWPGFAEASSAGGKGEGIFSRSSAAPQQAGAVVLEERAVASARDLPLPPIGAYCAHCGCDTPTPHAQCGECSASFCTPHCKEKACSTWHHTADMGLCSEALTSLLQQLSQQLREAYLHALFKAAQEGAGGAQPEAAGGEEEEEEGEMGAEELCVVQQVFTDCILSLKVVSTLSRCGALGALRSWTCGLSESQREKGSAILENFVSNVSETIQSLDTAALALAYDVCVTNSWPGEVGRHLFAAHSLINHSCAPNAKCVMQPNATVRIVTTQVVQPGDELCIDYTDGNAPANLAPAEREVLEQQWGHPCLCPVCRPAQS